MQNELEVEKATKKPFCDLEHELLSQPGNSRWVVGMSLEKDVVFHLSPGGEFKTNCFRSSIEVLSGFTKM